MGTWYLVNKSGMVTLYNKSENNRFFLEQKWELLWQLNLNVTCQHFVLLQNFIYQVFSQNCIKQTIFFKLCYIYHYYSHISEVNELHEQHKIMLHNE